MNGTRSLSARSWPEVIANFTQTDVSKDDGKKTEKTTTFAYAFCMTADGRWIVKQ